MGVIKSNKKFIFILVLLVLLSGLYTYLLPYLYTGEKGTVTSKMYLYFEGADKGLDPKGKKFDIYEIKNAKVLEPAIEKTELTEEITADTLANLITIKSVVPKNLLDEITAMPSLEEQTKAEEISQNGYYPNEYYIGIRDTGIVSTSKLKNLLSNVMTEYQAYFDSKYLVQPSFEPMLSEEDILSFDYPEMVQALSRETDIVLNFINAYSNLAPDYKSVEEGTSFGDLYERVELIKNVDIKEIKGIVEGYSLTKSYDQRVKYNEYLIKRLQLLQDKKDGEKLSIYEMVSQYENDSSLVVLSEDVTGINLAPENEFYNRLVNELAQVSIESTTAKYRIEDIRLAITNLQNQALDQASYDTLAAKTKEDVKSIIGKVKAFREEAKELATEYYYIEYIENSIAVDDGLHYSRNTNGNILANFGVLILLVVLILLLLYKSSKIRKLPGMNEKSKYISRRFKREKETSKNV